MNRSEKIAHLRKLADALEEGRVILCGGIPANTGHDGIPFMTNAVWDYKPKPDPVECWANAYPMKKLFLQTSEKGARNNLTDGGRTIHMREVEE